MHLLCLRCPKQPRARCFPDCAGLGGPANKLRVAVNPTGLARHLAWLAHPASASVELGGSLGREAENGRAAAPILAAAGQIRRWGWGLLWSCQGAKTDEILPNTEGAHDDNARSLSQTLALQMPHQAGWFLLSVCLSAAEFFQKPMENSVSAAACCGCMCSCNSHRETRAQPHPTRVAARGLDSGSHLQQPHPSAHAVNRACLMKDSCVPCRCPIHISWLRKQNPSTMASSLTTDKTGGLRGLEAWSLGGARRKGNPTHAAKMRKREIEHAMLAALFPCR